MNQTDRDERKRAKSNLLIQAFFGAGVIALIAALVYLFNFYYSTGIGAEQPIPFSHRVHVAEKRISCFLCHPGAIDTSRAGVPPLETCMLCHHRIAIHYPPIHKLREFFFRGEPVIWQKVYDLPDFVYFDHSVHLFRSIDCGHCHGDVPAMDRIVLNQKLEMGFCIQCHRDYKATHDCFTCHR
ncbi:MAG: hypothetical protein A4E73_02986 [Syntrophaceae bacterium PtaU1.Bin231]|nr:MAG: hypothetical protein A4E73_02986 [Syntrophaceae bacterium PtaU1.Bin231]